MTTILVIDDEEQMRETIIEVLSINGFNVIEAESGSIGLEVALAKMPDLILCDIQMLDLDGYDVLRALRQNSATASIPFIFLTSLSTKGDFRRGMQLGADDYLTKPFNVSELLDAVNVRLNKKETITQPLIQALQQAEDRLNSILQDTNQDLNAGKLALETRIRWGLLKGEFQVYYQPQMDLVTHKVIGAEALVRWLDPERGLIAPSEFIPAAEASGLIVPLGEWVLETACTQAQNWINHGFPNFRVSVNLSLRQFTDPDLAIKIENILEKTGLEPTNLELEVTESCLVGDFQQAVATLHTLRNLGISIAIDDFGTGYASLSYLKQFPCQTLKIDRCFIRHVNEDNQNAVITTAVIQLAHLLNIKVVAEGVETLTELNFLQEQQCDLIQGYWLSRPLSFIEFGQKFVPENRPLFLKHQYAHALRYGIKNGPLRATGT